MALNLSPDYIGVIVQIEHVVDTGSKGEQPFLNEAHLLDMISTKQNHLYLKYFKCYGSNEAYKLSL